MSLKKLTISVIALFPLMVSSSAWALPSQHDILIVELQVRSGAVTGAADQEFVELYNTTDQPINVSTWKLQYKSATGITWSDKATLHGTLDAHSRYLLVSDKFPNPPTTAPGEPILALDVFSAGLSDTGGHIRIADFIIPAVPVVHDLVGWGTTANAAEGNTPAAAPAGGKSLQRRSSDGNFTDTDNNANDFEISPNPSPQTDPLFVAPVNESGSETIPEPDPEATALDSETAVPSPEPEQTSTDTSSPPSSPTSVSSEDSQATPSVVLAPPQISELLPNPAAPASDSTDEFIELYNPNDRPLALGGYKLQTGNNFSYSYTFDTDILAAHEFRAFLITQTGDILSNTSGQARLLDPTGIVVAQTNGYESAEEGKAWALINNAWQWTNTPTPNQANILTVEVPRSVGVVKASTVKVPTTKTPAKTSATTTKTKTPTVPKTSKTTATPERQVYQDPATTPPTLHPAILAGVGALTILYAGYEYRYDAINTLHRLQRYRDIRRSSRTAASGR